MKKFILNYILVIITCLLVSCSVNTIERDELKSKIK